MNVSHNGDWILHCYQIGLRSENLGGLFDDSSVVLWADLSLFLEELSKEGELNFSTLEEQL